MKKVNAQPYIEATLDDLGGCHGLESTMCQAAKDAFVGKHRDPVLLRIATFEKDIDGVNFRHGELLRRFACIPPHGQKQLVLASVSAVRQHEVNLLHLSVQWSQNSRRLILVNANAWVEGHKWVSMDFLR